MKTIKECITFLRAGPKRKTALRNSIADTFPKHNLSTPATLCTENGLRDVMLWSLRTTCAIVRSFHGLADARDTVASDQAAQLSCRVKLFEFAIFWSNAHSSSISTNSNQITFYLSVN